VQYLELGRDILGTSGQSKQPFGKSDGDFLVKGKGIPDQRIWNWGKSIKSIRAMRLCGRQDLEMFQKKLQFSHLVLRGPCLAC
jgi:hypothetical protein